MKIITLKKLFLVSIMLIAFNFSPHIASAETNYELLTPLVTSTGEPLRETSFPEYLKIMFQILISLASVIAVLMIVYGGVKYMSSDAFSQKKEGKEIISRTLWGIALIIAAWVILYTINPNILRLDMIEQSIDGVNSNTATSSGAGSSGAFSNDSGAPVGNPSFPTPQGGNHPTTPPPTTPPPGATGNVTTPTPPQNTVNNPQGPGYERKIEP